MTKIIEINACMDCYYKQGPEYEYETGKCIQKSMCKKERKTLNQVNSLPSWCPLPDKEEK